MTEKFTKQVSAGNACVPSVEQKHLSSIVLLKALPFQLRLNNAPFGVIHVLTFGLYIYFCLTHTPIVDDSSTSPGHLLPANLTSAAELHSTAEIFNGNSVQLDAAFSSNDVQDLLQPELDYLHSEDEGTIEVTKDAAIDLDSTDDEEITPMPEMWEPKTPQDWVKLASVIIIVLQALVNLFCVWMVDVAVFCKYKKVNSISKADSIKVTPHQYHGKPEVVPLVRRSVTVPGKPKVRPCPFCLRRPVGFHVPKCPKDKISLSSNRSNFDRRFSAPSRGSCVVREGASQ